MAFCVLDEDSSDGYDKDGYPLHRPPYLATKSKRISTNAR